MNVTVTNLGAVAVPFSSSQDKGFATALSPNEPYTLNSDAVTVANVGDNPSAAEEFAAGMGNLLEKLGELVTFWRKHVAEQADDSTTVRVSIANHGTNGLRVLLGSNLNEVHVGAGGTYEATAADYVEIRELGV